MRKLIAVLVVIALAIVGLAGAAEVQQDPTTGEIFVDVRNPEAGIKANVNDAGDIISLSFRGENVVNGDIITSNGMLLFSTPVVAYWDSRWENGQNLAVKVTNGMLDTTGIQSGDILTLVPRR